MSFQKYASLYIQLNEDEWKPSYLDKNKGIVDTRFEAFKDLDIKDLHASDIKLWFKNINDVGNNVKRGLVQGSISSLNDFTTDWKQYNFNPFSDEFDRVRSHFSACSAVNSLVSLQNIISNIGA